MQNKQKLEVIFRENLKYYRIRSKLSQEKLSGLLSKNINYINMIERGKSIPPLPMIERIAEILNVEPHYFFIPLDYKESFDKIHFIEEASLQIANKTQEILFNLFNQ